MIRALAPVALCVSAMHAQPAPALRFAVASIKPTPADRYNEGSGIPTGHGRLTGNHVTLRRCIQGAYAVGPNQIVGGPPWVDSDRFEIDAKADLPVGDSMLMVMLRSLLADRFKLAMHRETRAIEALVLEVARNGPKLEKAADGASETDSGHGRIDAKVITMNRFAEVLSRQTDLPVVNRTGLEGAFNLKLEWSPEADKAVKPGQAPPDNGPSLFTALQGLGLRLQARKTPLDVLVIDHAERPSEN
jgi:uncharacterized protein (TIGR03435 family)